MMVGVKVALALLVLLLSGCASSPQPAAPEPPTSWLGMAPGDARSFSGPGGELVLIFVDETYDIDGIDASALTWSFGNDYTSDYFVEDDDGSVCWYGRKGSWRVSESREDPRRVEIVEDRATFDDRAITLSEDGPVELETPDGVYTRD